MKTIKEIEDEMLSIDKQLETYQALIQRRGDLAQLRLLALRLFPDPKAKGKAPTYEPPAAKPATAIAIRGIVLTHADYLKMALSKNGPLTISQLLIATRAEGWKGSGVDKVDKKRLYVVLYREKHLFRAVGDGKWGLVQKTLAESA
jgi:hypothetical protein